MLAVLKLAMTMREEARVALASARAVQELNEFEPTTSRQLAAMFRYMTAQHELSRARQQMADVLALPLGTLKSRLFRARLALRDELGAYLADRKSRK